MKDKFPRPSMPQHDGSKSPFAPAFVAFCPRSGSTWLRMLLNAHPDVSCGPEFSFFSDKVGLGGQMRAFLDPLSHVGLRTALSPPLYFSLLSQYLNATYATAIAEHKPDATIVVDKSSSNATSLDLIPRIYPNTKVIVLLRDPADTVRSIIRASHSWNPDFPDTPVTAFEFWEAHMSKILHHVGAFSDVHWIQYEDLKASPQTELRACLQFLNAADLPSENIDEICEAASLNNLKKLNWHDGKFFGNRPDPTSESERRLASIVVPQRTLHLYAELTALSRGARQRMIQR